jgi:hypothetical protein
MIVRLIAFLIVATFLALALLIPARPTPLLVEAHPAEAKTWVDVWSAPPQFCPAPMPICTGDDCTRRSKA